MTMRIKHLMVASLSFSLVFLLFCSVQYSSAQSEESFSQKDFVLLLFKTKQFDTITESNLVTYQASVDDFTTVRTYSDLVNTATIIGQKRFLEHLGYCPDGGFNLDKILTYGDFAVTLVKVLHLDKPENNTPEDYIALLVEEGIIETREAETPMTRQEVLDAFEKANIPAIETHLPDYQKPLSPIE